MPITASDYESLIDAIIKDRANNQRPIGDPPREYQAYVVKHWPHFAGAASPTISSPVKTEGKTLRERVTNWLANRYSQKGNSELVSEEEAERRAKICSQCPHNQEEGNDCPPCVKNNQRISFLLREGRQTATPIKACEIMGQDNSAAVWLPIKMLNLSKVSEAPDFCWMK